MRRPPNLMKTAPFAQPPPAPTGPRPPANYLDLYGLSKPPFGGVTDRSGYILFGSHTRAFDLLVDHLANGSGVIVLQGEEGIGKTETLNAAATVAGEAGVHTIMVGRPPAGRISLNQLVAALNGAANTGETNIEDAIRHFFDPPRKALLADDTDLMPGNCVRLLSSLAQRASSEPGGSVIVLGNSTDLPPNPTQPDLFQLFSVARNTIRLPTLGFAEVRQFIERSLWTAGGTTRRLIAADAMKLIIARSGGLPGTTNRLMEAVLAAGFARGDTMITAKTVAAAMGPAPSRPRPRSENPSSGVPARAMQLVAAGLLVSGASLFLYKGLHGDLDRPAPASPAPVAAAPPQPQLPAAPPSPPPQRIAPVKPAAALPPGLVAALLKRGNQSLDLGDIAAARLLFGRAAEAGNAAAATALGKTYDPSYSTIGQTPDPARAAQWYRKAVALGDTQSSGLLKRLNSR